MFEKTENITERNKIEGRALSGTNLHLARM